MSDGERLFNWFAGICSCGGFGILEDSETEQFGSEMLSYSTAIHCHLKKGKKQFVPNTANGLNGESIALHANTRIFMCSLTESTSSGMDSNPQRDRMMESLAMPPANIGAITLTSLSSLGFLTAESMAPKIAMLLELCESLLSAVDEYEFGHKAVTEMAAAAGEKLVQFVAENVDDGMVDAEEKEEAVLVEDFEDDDALNAALVTGSGSSRYHSD